MGQGRDSSTVIVATELMEADISIEDSNEPAVFTYASRFPMLSHIRNHLSSKLHQFPALAWPLHLRNFVGPGRETLPNTDTIVWNLASLIIFFISLCLAARYPTREVRIAFGSFSGLIFILVLGSTSLDFANQGKQSRGYHF